MKLLKPIFTQKGNYLKNAHQVKKNEFSIKKTIEFDCNLVTLSAPLNQSSFDFAAAKVGRAGSKLNHFRITHFVINTRTTEIAIHLARETASISVTNSRSHLTDSRRAKQTPVTILTRIQMLHTLISTHWTISEKQAGPINSNSIIL